MKKQHSSQKNNLLDFIILSGGAIIGQGITILFSPLLSRVYSPEEMGFYTLVLTAVAMFESAVCLRYELVIVSEAREANIQPLIAICVRLAIPISAIVTIGYLIYVIAAKQIESQQWWIVLFIFPIMLLHGISCISTSYNNRKKEYQRISYASIMQSGVHNSFSALMGLFHFGVLGLILGRILGYLANVYVSIGAKRFCKAYKIVRENKTADCIYLLKENRKQALFSTPAVILSCAAYSIINLFIHILYGDAVLGLYSYSYRLLGLPLIVVSANLSRMFFKEAAVEFHETGRMKRSFSQLFFPLFGIAILMVVLFKLFAPTVFAVVFGEQWKEAGVYVQILAPMFAIRFIATSFTNVTIINGKQIISFILQMTYLLATVLLYAYSSVYHIDILAFLKWMNILFCIIYTVYFFVILKMCVNPRESSEKFKNRHSSTE